MENISDSKLAKRRPVLFRFEFWGIIILISGIFALGVAATLVFIRGDLRQEYNQRADIRDQKVAALSGQVTEMKSELKGIRQDMTDVKKAIGSLPNQTAEAVEKDSGK